MNLYGYFLYHLLSQYHGLGAMVLSQNNLSLYKLKGFDLPKDPLAPIDLHSPLLKMGDFTIIQFFL